MRNIINYVSPYPLGYARGTKDVAMIPPSTHHWLRDVKEPPDQLRFQIARFTALSCSGRAHRISSKKAS